MCLSIEIGQRPVALLAFHLSLDPGPLGGVETQRQWSDRARARTTSILKGLISWVTLAAHRLQQQHPVIHRTPPDMSSPTQPLPESSTWVPPLRPGIRSFLGEACTVCGVSAVH